MIRDGLLKGRRFLCVWMIPRSSVLKLIKDHGLDDCRPALEPPDGRLLLCTRDRNLKLGAVDFNPRLVYSLFGLGNVMATTPSWAVVIDFCHVGREWAYEAAERVKAAGDSPYLVGVGGEDEGGRPKPARDPFDVTLTRPITARTLAACLGELHPSVRHKRLRFVTPLQAYSQAARRRVR